MRKRCETRILEMQATMRNWNVNELLRTRCCTLSWVKTLKTLQKYHDEELECLRSAPQTRRNTFQGENLEDVHQYHPKRELECQRAARQAA